jgi:hypothetical protein
METDKSVLPKVRRLIKASPTKFSRVLINRPNFFVVNECVTEVGRLCYMFSDVSALSPVWIVGPSWQPSAGHDLSKAAGGRSYFRRM